jgi:signal transduction histidine kinase
MAGKPGLSSRKIASDKRLLIRHWFYIVILALVWAQILAFPSEPEYVVWPVLLGIGASIYTAFKMIHPLQWHESVTSNVILFSLDLLVCSALVVLSGGIHSPFILYTLAPIVTSAILLAQLYTLIIAVTTFGYVLVASFVNSVGPTNTLGDLNVFAIYLLTITLAGVLPYLMNAKNEQDIKVKAIISERQHLAREIHDNLCQTIYGLRWQIQMLRNGMLRADPQLTDDRIERLLEEAEIDARNLIASLRSHKLGGSLVDELRTYLGKCEEEYGISYDLNEHGQAQDTDEVIHSEVLHICEEALRNSIKHSRCRHVVIELFNSKSQLRVTVSDDGCGFDYTRQLEGRGLLVMKERAESVGGHLEVESSPGDSTKVRLEVPRRCPSEMILLSR